MKYKTLEKMFYADASSDRYANHKKLHADRLAAEATIRTGIQLETGQLFCSVPLELSVASERILSKEQQVTALWSRLPYVARGASIRSFIMDEVVCSNEMEGIHSTRRQIELALESAEGKVESTDGVAEKEHPAFLEFARLYLELADVPKPPHDPADIRAIFDSVTEGVLDPKDRPDGKMFRSGPVVIENNRGKVLHQGVQSEAEITRLLHEMLALADRDDIPRLYLGVLRHFLFEYIHPFYDGNGRTGRYLLALDLIETLSLPTVLSLSRTIAQNKNAYYKAFDAVEKPLNCSDATPFAHALFDFIEQAQEEVLSDLGEKRSKLDNLRQRISRLENWDERSKDILFYAAQLHIFDAFEEMTLTGLSDHLRVSKPTASRASSKLMTTGFLEKTSQRPVVYKLSRKSIDLLGLA